VDLLVGALGDGVLQVEDLFGHLLDEYASTVDLRVFAPASSILGADLDLDEDVLWPVEMGDQMGHRDGAHLGGHDIGCRSIAITELSDVDAATILKDDLVLEDLLVVVVRFGPCHDHLVDVEGGGRDRDLGGHVGRVDTGQVGEGSGTVDIDGSDREEIPVAGC